MNAKQPRRLGPFIGLEPIKDSSEGSQVVNLASFFPRNSSLRFRTQDLPEIATTQLIFGPPNMAKCVSGVVVGFLLPLCMLIGKP